jgi:DNA-binding response OmpR family regulator
MSRTSEQPGLRVAVVDVDSGFLHVLARRASGAGWELRVRGEAFPVRDLVSLRVNALVVNLAILGGEAWEHLAEVCRELPSVGVVVCTGQSSVAQRVRGLRLGADDWVTKPCHPEELIARVEAVVRRRRASEAGAPQAVVSGELSIRADHFQAYVGARSVDLTRREFELIHLLAGAEGRVLEREDIYRRVWGYEMARGDRSVDVFVRKLRQKLEKASPGWRYIHTHFGVGYRFAAERAEDPGVPQRAEGAEGAAGPPAPPGPPAAAPPGPPASAPPGPSADAPRPLARALS